MWLSTGTGILHVEINIPSHIPTILKNSNFYLLFLCHTSISVLNTGTRLQKSPMTETNALPYIIYDELAIIFLNILNIFTVFSSHQLMFSSFQLHVICIIQFEVCVTNLVFESLLHENKTLWSIYIKCLLKYRNCMK